MPKRFMLWHELRLDLFIRYPSESSDIVLRIGMSKDILGKKETGHDLVRTFAIANIINASTGDVSWQGDLDAAGFFIGFAMSRRFECCVGRINETANKSEAIFVRFATEKQKTFVSFDDGDVYRLVGGRKPLMRSIDHPFTKLRAIIWGERIFCALDRAASLHNLVDLPDGIDAAIERQKAVPRAKEGEAAIVCKWRKQRIEGI